MPETALTKYDGFDTNAEGLLDIVKGIIIKVEDRRSPLISIIDIFKRSVSITIQSGLKADKKILSNISDFLGEHTFIHRSSQYKRTPEQGIAIASVHYEMLQRTVLVNGNLEIQDCSINVIFI